VKVLGVVGASVLAILVVVLVAVGGYQLHWWLRGQEVNRSAQINQQGYGRQNALVEQILDDIKDAETLGIPAGQRIAIISQICDSAGKLTGSIELPFAAQQFINQECI